MIKKCTKCEKVYYHELDSCMFCNSLLENIKQGQLTVKSITQVNVPSPEHKKVPYYSVLLEDSEGNLVLQKSMKEVEVGDIISEDEKSNQSNTAMNIHIGVIGTGVTGVGIAEVTLDKGMKVTLISRTQERLNKITEQINTFIAKGRSAKQQQAIMKNFFCSTELESLKDCDLIIESVLEDKATKDEYFKKLNTICKPEAIITSNTSSISIAELSNSINKPEQFAGLHFFNPVPKMALVEIVKTNKTSEQTIAFLKSVSESLEKTPITLKDSPSFVVNRLLIPYLNDAVLLLEQGVASKEDIDTACKLGLNYPMGPLALIDLIGIDVFIEIMNNLHKQTGKERFKPAQLAQQLMKEGKLGKKTGEGFYVYKK